MLLAIDPGGDIGYALFDSAGRVQDCYALPWESRDSLPWNIVTRVVIERPVFYPGSNPADIVTLSARYGTLRGRAEELDLCIVDRTAAQWKGSLPKPVTHARLRNWMQKAGQWQDIERMLGRLSLKRRADALDALGLGLVHLGLLGMGLVPCGRS